jgi:glyoxylase-like metal-dependent hydrolase (beta-lactamase superfamily II)
MIHIESYILLKEYQTNTYLVWDDLSKDAILVDPSAPSEDMAQIVKSKQLKLKLVINTHGHGDHIAGNNYFASLFSCPVAIHPLDANMLIDNRKNMSTYMGYDLKLKSADIMLNAGDKYYLGEHTISIIHTPGHTAGSVCLLIDKYLISGDTLFEQSIGRTDFPGGSHTDIIKSIKEKLFILPDDILVFPGHGPNTSIGLEKMNNPFVN